MMTNKILKKIINQKDNNQELTFSGNNHRMKILKDTTFSITTVSLSQKNKNNKNKYLNPISNHLTMSLPQYFTDLLNKITTYNKLITISTITNNFNHQSIKKRILIK